MNRENKKKSFEKNYYKTHPCNESFVCKVCGKQAQGAIIGTIARTVSPASIWTMNRETGRQAAAV